MTETIAGAIRRLEELAAWHRFQADHAGSTWIWDARLRTAEDLERQATALRAQKLGQEQRHANPAINHAAKECVPNGEYSACWD